MKELRKDLWILKMTGLKPNYSALSRKHSVSRNTVRNYDSGYQEKARTRKKASRLDRYRDGISEKINVEISRIPFNIHYKYTGGLSYMDTLRKMEADSKVSLRGLRQDATLFNEIVIDANTMYFGRNGGYEFAKKFYEVTFCFIEKKFGFEYVVSAVMDADEINIAVSDDLNKPVYHYHLHAMVLAVVEKEILWSK